MNVTSMFWINLDLWSILKSFVYKAPGRGQGASLGPRLSSCASSSRVSAPGTSCLTNTARLHDSSCGTGLSWRVLHVSNYSRFLKIALAVLFPLPFHTRFKVSLFKALQNPAGIMIGTTWSLQNTVGRTGAFCAVLHPTSLAHLSRSSPVSLGGISGFRIQRQYTLLDFCVFQHSGATANNSTKYSKLPDGMNSRSFFSLQDPRETHY